MSLFRDSFLFAFVLIASLVSTNADSTRKPKRKYITFTADGTENICAKYVGCYTDDWDRLLTMGGRYVNNSMTIELCGEYCVGRPYQVGNGSTGSDLQMLRYFGLEDKNECWCGSEGDSLTKYGDSLTGCDDPCAGTEKQTCGSGWHLQAYEYYNCDDRDQKTVTKISGAKTTTNKKEKGISTITSSSPQKTPPSPEKTTSLSAVMSKSAERKLKQTYFAQGSLFMLAIVALFVAVKEYRVRKSRKGYMPLPGSDGEKFFTEV